MSENVHWARVTALPDDLYTAADGLERIFPMRNSPSSAASAVLVAAYMFDFDLNPASTHRYDARARDGRQIEIKLPPAKSFTCAQAETTAIIG